MAKWEMNAGEELRVGKDWSDDLNGASISAVRDPVLERGATFTLERIGYVSATSTYWLRGGTAGTKGRAVISVEADDGEVLSEYVDVVIL